MFSSRTTKAGPSAERRKERDAAWARTKELRRRDEEAKKEDIAKIEEIEGRPFRDVPEGRFVIRPIPVEETKIKAIGTCGLLVCIGIYMRVTEKYFFLAHIQGDMTGVQLDDAFKLSEKDKEQKTKKIKIWIAKKLNKEIQEGMAYQAFQLFVCSSNYTRQSAQLFGLNDCLIASIVLMPP